MKGRALMKIIDLTHTIAEGMPVYPGTEGPSLKQASSYEKDGFKETLMTMYSHTGTHMDAPAHLFAHRTTLDAFDASQFVDNALVIDCTDLGEGEKITLEKIASAGSDADCAEFLLFRTGWDKRWGSSDYFGDYPSLTAEAADYLIKSGKKGVGLDVIGIDPIADANLTIHKQLFKESEIVVIENLKNLDLVGGGLFTLCALPMKYYNADGAPIRAIAILED